MKWRKRNLGEFLKRARARLPESIRNRSDWYELGCRGGYLCTEPNFFRHYASAADALRFFAAQGSGDPAEDARVRSAIAESVQHLEGTPADYRSAKIALILAYARERAVADLTSAEVCAWVRSAYFIVRAFEDPVKFMNRTARARWPWSFSHPLMASRVWGRWSLLNRAFLVRLSRVPEHLLLRFIDELALYDERRRYKYRAGPGRPKRDYVALDRLITRAETEELARAAERRAKTPADDLVREELERRNVPENEFRRRIPLRDDLVADVVDTVTKIQRADVDSLPEELRRSAIASARARLGLGDSTRRVVKRRARSLRETSAPNVSETRRQPL